MQFFSFVLGATLAPWDMDWVAQQFERGQPPNELFPHWPTNYTGGVNPIPCHSHNDYWRDVPLFSALRAGCIGVEADVWLFGDELFIGHDASSLALHRTLKTLYIQPLLEILDNRNPQSPQPGGLEVLNGVFDTVPSQTLVLLVDIKARGQETWPVLQEQLAPLRDRGYLTYFNGTNVIERPITVVGTGRTPYELLVKNSSYRDIFFDAPLDRLGGLNVQGAGPTIEDDPNYDIEQHVHAYLSDWSNESKESSIDGVSDTVQHGGVERIAPYDTTNSYYASASFKKAVGFPFGFRITNKQRRLIREQVHKAHERGLKARYWSTPGWPRILRHHVWRVLIEEGVDVLNIDDLRSPIEK